MTRRRERRLTLRDRIRQVLTEGPTTAKVAAAIVGEPDYRKVDRRLREMWKSGEVKRSAVGSADSYTWEYTRVDRCQTCWADLSWDSHHPDCNARPFKAVIKEGVDHV